MWPYQIHFSRFSLQRMRSWYEIRFIRYAARRLGAPIDFDVCPGRASQIIYLKDSRG